MSDQLATELKTTQKMLSVLLRHHGLLQWCDCWGAGENEGGVYVSLFHSRAKFRVARVYAENFGKLPDFIRAAIPKSAGELSTERERVSKSGKLYTCPPFAFTRYQIGGGEENDKWYFGDTLWVTKEKVSVPPSPAIEDNTGVGAYFNLPPPHQPREKPGQPQVNDKPPVFTNVADALDWSIAQGAYSNRDQARDAYIQLRDAKKPGDAQAAYAIWIGHVRSMGGKNG